MARRQHTVAIILNARDRASGVLGKFGGTLGRIAEFAGGTLLAGGLRATAGAISAIGRSAIESVGNAQALEMGLQGLLTEALMYERATNGIYHQTLSFGDASELASEQVQSLLSYIEQTAIVSPFETTQVEQVARIGLAARLSADQVKEFTGAFLDYSAVHGITSSNLSFAAEQFLQLKQAGALTTIDLRQLRRLGIDISRIVGIDMSSSLEEATARFGELSPAAQEVFSGMDLDVKAFNAAAADSPEMIDAIFQKFILLSEEGTAGAAERMAGTVTGMLSTFKDIGEVGSRRLFRPIIEAVSPTVAGILERLSALATGPELAALGEQAGAWLTTNLPLALDYLKTKWGELQPALETVRTWLGTNLPLALDYLKTKWGELQPALETGRAWLEEKLPVAGAALKTAWDTTLRPALEGLIALFNDTVSFERFATVLKVTAVAALAVLVVALLAAAAPFIMLGALLVALGLAWRKWGEQVKTTLKQLQVIIVYFAMRASQKVREVVRVWQTNFRLAGAIIQGLRERVASAFDGIKAAIQGVIGRVQAFIDRIRSIELPDWLTPGSPTPFEMGLRGIAAAMQEVSRAAAPQFATALAGGVQGGESRLSSLQMGGDVISVTVNDRGAAALLMAMIEDRRRGRLNAGMRMM